MIEQFTDAMRRTGIEPPADIQADGTLHRFHISGDKPRSENGWFVLHDNPPAGAFGSWKHKDFSHTWSAKEYLSLTTEEKVRYKRNMEAQKQQREAEQVRIHAEARQKATDIWNHSEPAATDHAYLVKKQIKPHGLKQSKRALVCPVRNVNQELVGLQYINPDGSKRFLTGTPKKGSYHALGDRPKAELYLCEGYATGATIHEATGQPVAVAFDSGNLQPVAEQLRNKYPSIKLIICADNDRFNEENTGLIKAKSAAAAVNGLLVEPEFPEGSTGTDFNDLAAVSGLDEVKKQIEAAAPPGANEWSNPEPLTSRIEPEAYPLDALPATLRAAVEEVTAFVRAPVAMVASVALAAVSVAGQHLADIERAKKLSGPVGLFHLILGDSGERKSTVDGFFTSAVRDWQRQQVGTMAPVLKKYQAELEAWESKRAGLKDKIRQSSKAGKSTEDDEQRLKMLVLKRPEAPKVPWLIHGDATPEALAFDLAQGWPSGAVFSAEAGLVFGSHGMGKDSVMRNLGLLNILWDGGNGHRISRRSSESFTVDGVRLATCLQIQEATLREFLGKSGVLARGSGFLARFLISWPESTQGRRPFREPPEHWPALAEYNRRITRLLDTPARITDTGELEPEMMKLSPEAKAAWISFHDLLEAELAHGGELHEVRDIASKTADNAARLSALFHLFETGSTGDIQPETMQQACRLAAWHLNESRRFFGELAQPVELVDAAKVEQWLITNCRTTGELATNRRHLQQFGSVRDGDRLQAAIAELETLNRIRITTEGKQKFVELNPALLEVPKC